MSKYHSSNIKHVKRVKLLVKDINKSLNFYINNLGFDLIKEENSLYYLGVNKEVLLILKENKNALPKTRTTGLYHFAILLPKRGDLGSLLFHFIKNNIGISGGSDHGVSEAIYLNDPDGNGIEVYVDKDDTLWPRTKEGLEMVSEPLDYQDIINSRSNDNQFKLPEKTIIGHVHFHVDDILKGENFFVNILGFNLLQNMDSASFVSDGGYHHHIGFNIWAGRNVKNRDENMVGLISYFLNVSDNHKNDFIKKLKDNNVEIFMEKSQMFFLDINNVKVYF